MSKIHFKKTKHLKFHCWKERERAAELVTFPPRADAEIYGSVLVHCNSSNVELVSIYGALEAVRKSNSRPGAAIRPQSSPTLTLSTDVMHGEERATSQ